ncbi:hypothetical protein JDS87_02165 [Bacillus cereus]|uniref:hypothetical protein n=1 Tax=Bacillus cereus TaxID=1396 RepID=UPI0018F2841B|nr:hypothetical protein [Bacillus cereus]MBJ8050844.1 hypothetical protein [Bacillus cereus]
MEQIALVCSIFFVLLGFEAVAKDVEEFWWESKEIAGYICGEVIIWLKNRILI